MLRPPPTASISSGWHVLLGYFSRWSDAIERHITAAEIAALIVSAVALLAYVFLSLRNGTKRELDAALRPYRIHAAEAPSDETGAGERFTRRLVLAFSGFAERQGFQETLTTGLQRSGLPLSAGEFMVICASGAVILLAVGGFVAGLIGLVLGLAASAAAPFVVLRVLAERRSRRFESQIPDVLKLLAASLRAGFSLLQAMDAIVEQVGDPMQSELQRAFAATRLGTPIEDALERVSERVASRDFSWTVTAIRIQREVGGNLAEILDTVANTMMERDRLRREVRSLTAEARISAVILAILPIAMGLMIYVVNRPYISTLFHTMGGQLALAAGAMLELVGVYWLHRTVQIEL